MLGLAVLAAVFSTTMAASVDVVQPPIRMENNYGFIESPGFPNGYGSELNLTWVVETQPGFVIEIDFTDFYLEASYDEDLGGKCVYDYVTVGFYFLLHCFFFVKMILTNVLYVFFFFA